MSKQNMHALTCTTTASKLAILNGILDDKYKFTYTSSSSSGGASSSGNITSLTINNPKDSKNARGLITDANIEAIKELLTTHIGDFEPAGRSALGACVCLSPHAHARAPCQSLRAFWGRTFTHKHTRTRTRACREPCMGSKA